MKNLNYLTYLSETKSFYDEKFGQSNSSELNDEEKSKIVLKKLPPQYKKIP
jgi:hypothetical protein